MDVSTSKLGYFVNRGVSSGRSGDEARYVATTSAGGLSNCAIVEAGMDRNACYYP
jgi:hypothetical protein